MGRENKRKLCVFSGKKKQLSVLPPEIILLSKKYTTNKYKRKLQRRKRVFEYLGSIFVLLRYTKIGTRKKGGSKKSIPATLHFAQ